MPAREIGSFWTFSCHSPTPGARVPSRHRSTSRPFRAGGHTLEPRRGHCPLLLRVQALPERPAGPDLVNDEPASERYLHQIIQHCPEGLPETSSEPVLEPCQEHPIPQGALP